MTDRTHYTREPAPWVGAASDIGCRHHVNQDALSLAVRSGADRAAIVAVSDGVSTALGSEMAALVAAQTAVDRIVAHMDEPNESIHAALTDAFALAHQAVLEAAPEGEEPAACTLICAVVRDEKIWVANIGDTRAYWLSDDGQAQLLSTDDSMAQARIQLGVAREDAERSANAHAITKWLGRGATDLTPTVQMMAPETNGWLLACSDGLWNYASEPGDMRALLDAQLDETHSPVAIAERLVNWAKQAGGKDNITVALVRQERSASQTG